MRPFCKRVLQTVDRRLSSSFAFGAPLSLYSTSAIANKPFYAEVAKNPLTFGSKRSRNRGIFDTTSRPKSKKKYNNTLAFTYLCICCNTIYAEVAKPGHNPLHERQALTECFANGRSALILKLRFRGAVVLIFNLCNRQQTVLCRGS